MRIEADGQVLTSAGLFLTADEASDLRDAMDDLLTGQIDDPSWHVHVSSADVQVEVAIAPELPAQ